jgi:hypothetical protein
MTMRKYDYYPAPPAPIRAAAVQARAGTGDIKTVIEGVEREHRGAVAVTEGELTGSMDSGVVGPQQYASAVNRRAFWAAAQLEVFADAIETYNRDSTDPWSIEQLNKQADLGAEAFFCLTGPGPDAPTEERSAYSRLVLQKEGELQSILDGHFLRLEANLDHAATAVTQALRREPTDAEVIALWKAGNLPEMASLAWPELHLRSIPMEGIDENLFGLTEQQIVDRLKDSRHALSAEELEWLTVNYPDAMKRFHDEWTLEDTVLLPPGQTPAGQPEYGADHGWILGPDGQWYPIEVPKPGYSSGPAYTESFGGLHNANGGWVSVDSRQGRIYAGEPPPTGLLILSGITGFTPQIVGDLSVGENQSDYITYDQNGNPITHQQAPDRPEAWSPPPSVPDSEPNPAPPGTWDPTQTDNPAKDRVDRGSSIADMVIGGLNGKVLSDQIDANNSFAGNVSFQSNGDGRRAVIQLSQVQYDPDSGEVNDAPWRGYGVVDDEGKIVGGYR